MKMKVAVVLVALVTFLATSFAKDKPAPMRVKALAYRVIPHENTSVYHTNGHSNTSCYGNGVNWVGGTSATVNCSTVTRPPQDITTTYRWWEVYQQLQETDGTVYTLGCKHTWGGSYCGWLEPGQTFEAKAKGTTMDIAARHEGPLGRKVRIRYKILDIRMPGSR